MCDTAVYLLPSLRLFSMAMTADDLQQRVEVTLARFIKAVGEMTSSSSNSTERHEPEGVPSRTAIDREAEHLPVKPSCRPWDYEDFTSRLQTFTPLKWFAKPPAASPLMCARHGWINKGRDLLSCPCCGRELCYPNPKGKHDGHDGQQKHKYEQAAFASQLTSAHHPLCPWNGNACPVEFLQLPVKTVDDLRTEFLTRLKSLMPLVAVTALPEPLLPSDFEEHCQGGMAHLANRTRALVARHIPLANTGDCQSVPEERHITKDQDLIYTDIEIGGVGNEGLGRAAAIAVFGWCLASSKSFSPSKQKPQTEDGGASVSSRICCTLCNRRVAPDNFLPLDVSTLRQSSDSGSTSSSPTGTREGQSSKRRRLSGGGTPLKPMNLAAEHRSFCPWVTVHPILKGRDVVEGDAVPGWRQSLDAVLNVEADQQIISKGDLKECDDPSQKKAEKTLRKAQKVMDVLARF